MSKTTTAPTTTLKTPYRDLLQPHTDAELAALRENFEMNGVIDPLEVAEGNILVNGHARYDWLRENKRPVEIRLVGGLTTPEQHRAYVLAKDLGHRSTPPTPKRLIEYIDVLLLANPQLSDQAIANMIGNAKSDSTVHRRRKELLTLKKLDPVDEVIDVKGVKRKVSHHASRKRLADLPVFFTKTGEDAQYVARYLDVIAPLPTVKGLQLSKSNIARAAKRELKQTEVLALPEAILPSDYQVHHSDFRNLDVADESIDLICTDVLWAVEYQKDWEALAEWAQRKLKPSGLFCTLHGILYIPQTVEALGKHLSFQAMIVVKYATALPIIAKSLNSCWRPAWVYSRPEGLKHKFGNLWNFIDVHEEPALKTKEYHKFQQSVEVFRVLVEKLSRPGDLVCDPQLGSGTTAVACKMLGRKFIGGDIDEKMVKIAKHRIATEGHVDSTPTLAV